MEFLEGSFGIDLVQGKNGKSANERLTNGSQITRKTFLNGFLDGPQ